jgi:hypothetical protein
MLKRWFPTLVALFIMVVGLFFIANTLVETRIVSPQSEGRSALLAVSGICVVAGLFFLILALKGGLKRRGKTVAEVRKEAVANLKAESLLADIALKDPNPDIRETAKKRLEEITE